MADNSSNNKRLAKNTLVLYVRMMVIMVVNLYISRVILENLGVDDYGIYNVVGGFVTMFSLLSNSLANAISRFITIELGKDDLQKLRTVFSTSLAVLIILSILIFLLIEAFGIWFLNAKMQIPESRLVAANWVLHCSALTFVVNLISIPYNSSIIAHEHMSAYAYISIAEVLLKLFAIMAVVLFTSDRLIVYSLLMLAAAVVIRILYGVYCSRHFSECRSKLILDRTLLREISSMASWNILGSGASVLNNQGINLLINLFFSVTVNAAVGIANQIYNAVTSFSSSFTTALNPQITKTYARGEYDSMRYLVYKGARFSFYLMLVLSLPIIIEAPTILKLWLKTVPPHTVIFARLTLVSALISVLTTCLFTVSMATGKIKLYQTVVGSLALSTFGFTYIAYALGAPVEATYFISIIVNSAIMVARILIVNRTVPINVKAYFTEVVLNAFVVTVASAALPCILHIFLEHNIVTFLFVCAVSVLSVCACSLFVGMRKSERDTVIGYARKIIEKI